MRFDSAISSERDIREYQLSCFDICSNRTFPFGLIGVIANFMEAIRNGGMDTTKQFNEKETASLFWMLRFGMS